MVPPNPRISPEEELKIVRKFLKKNNIDDLMMALSTWCCHAPGARISHGAISVPQETQTKLNLGHVVDWDTDGFFDAGQPGRLTIPDGFQGRYFVHATLSWYRILGTPWTVAERDGGFFNACLAKNGVGPLDGSRSNAAPVVTAKHTTQRILWEGELAAGDFVELNAWQEVDDEVVVDAWLTLRRV